MFIKSIQIENYKCFDKTAAIELSQGINLVLGRNNVGKTAFLEAISGSFDNKPFKDINTDHAAVVRDISRVEGEFHLSADEFLAFGLRFGNRIYSVQPPPDVSDWQNSFNENVFSSEKIIRLYFSAKGGEGADTQEQKTTADFFGTDGNKSTSQQRYFRFTRSDKKGVGVSWGHDSTGASNIFQLVTGSVRQHIYRFKAERLNLSQSETQIHLNLESNARNLAGALQQLTASSSKYDNLCGLVQEIFPDIFQVVTKNTGPSQCEILVWPVEPSTERDTALIPLSECGTGVSQILALLFILVTSKDPRVIIIDEPNSFLHPGAVKKLIEILKKYPQHQYIISTHAPEIIRSANASNILMMTREGGKTQIQRIDPNSLQDMKAALIEMGSSMSDVFGADSILWVEGETEEECFRILSDAWGDLPLGTSILKVRHTGDFEDKSRKDPRMVWDIYKKLSNSSNALMPPAVGFIFDREMKQDKDMAALSKDSGGTVRFLPRRMFENYLLHPTAITHALNLLPVMQGDPIKELEVQKWMLENGGRKPFLRQDKILTSLDDLEWLKEVHGAKFLEAVFQHFAKTEFQKTRDCLHLTKWLADNQKTAFEEVHEIVQSLSGSNKNNAGKIQLAA